MVCWSLWCFGGCDNLLPEMQPLPDGTIPDLPFDWADATYDPTWENLGLNWGMLCIHSLVYLGVTFWFQKRKDIL